MIYLCILAVLIGFLSSYFFNTLLGFSSALHSHCIALAPQSDFQELYQAIACGRSLKLFESDLGFKTLGIFHILVVSGAHFNFLSDALSKITFKRISPILKIGILFIFVLICEFQITALRAWFFLLFMTINSRLHLFTPKPLFILLSVLSTLACYPTQIAKYSLPLSWLACLGIYIGRSTFSRSVFCYLFLLPILTTFQTPSVWSIVINSFLTPIICLILFPMASASFIIPGLSNLCDYIWELLSFFSNTISPTMQPTSVATFTGSDIWFWILPLSINIYLILRKGNQS